jgi:hypothetical protein
MGTSRIVRRGISSCPVIFLKKDDRTAPFAAAPAGPRQARVGATVPKRQRCRCGSEAGLPIKVMSGFGIERNQRRPEQHDGQSGGRGYERTA